MFTALELMVPRESNDSNRSRPLALGLCVTRAWEHTPSKLSRQVAFPQLSQRVLLC